MSIRNDTQIKVGDVSRQRGPFVSRMRQQVGFFERRNMSQNRMNAVETFKPKVMDLDMLSTTEVEHGTIYEMNTPQGKAKMHSYPVFGGVELTFQEVTMKEIRHRAKPLEGMFEIHYCKEGRIECAFDNGKVLYMDENDISVGWKESPSYVHSTKFPTAYYKGINLSIYIPKAQEMVNKFVGHDRINLRDVCNRFCQDFEFGFVCRRESRLSDIFKSLYDLPNEVMPHLFQLKCMEIILLLSTITSDDDCCMPYFERKHVESVKRMHEFLVKNLHQKPTIEELAKTYGLAPTALKKCFKGIYGSSIHQYVKHMRIKKAAKDLVNTNDSILSIANRYGYENASKFAEAFRVIMGHKPSEYRKKNKMSEWIE